MTDLISSTDANSSGKIWGMRIPSGISEMIKGLVSAAFIALGTALYTLHYSPKISAFIASNRRLQPLMVNPRLAAGISLAIGGAIHLPKIFNKPAISEKKPVANEIQTAQFQDLLLASGFSPSSPIWNGYQISTKEFKRGDNKSVYLCYSKEKGYAMTSKLSEKEFQECYRNDKDPTGKEKMEFAKREFDRLKVPDALIKEYQELSSTQPGLVKILDAKIEGEPGEREQWVLMDYHKNGGLNDVLGNLSKEERLQFALRIAKSLESLHANGLTHRDVKPDNFVLDDQHLPVLLDVDLLCFGDSRLVEDEGYQEKRKSLGAPLYWAPEMFLKEFNAEEYDRQKADAWSFGWILYLLLLKSDSAFDNYGSISKMMEPYVEDKSKTAEKFRKACRADKIDKIGQKFLEKFSLDQVKMYHKSFEPLRAILKKFLEPDVRIRCTIADSGLIKALENLM